MRFYIKLVLLLAFSHASYGNNLLVSAYSEDPGSTPKPKPRQDPGPSKAELTNELSDVLAETSDVDDLDSIRKNSESSNEIKQDAFHENVHSQGSVSENTDAQGLAFDYECTACHWGAEILFKYHKMGWPPGTILNSISSLCSTFRIQPGLVCDGMVQSVGQQLFAVLDIAGETISPKDLCGMVYGGSCALQSKRLNGWSLDIPDLKLDPPPTPPPAWPVDTTKSSEKILHLSDTHIQLDYTEGYVNSCAKPVCCSPSDGRAKSPEVAAGPYGDYNCDLPESTFEELLRHAHREHPDIKYIFLTGDFPAHDVWRQNRTLNIESTRTVAKILERYFPKAKVFPAVGNHESFPVNMFPDSSVGGNYSISWLYSSLAEIYMGWLPKQAQQKTLQDGGYYSILMRPGLRVVSVNTNFCNNLNFWLLVNFTDPHDHLHWVYRQLHKAEVHKEKVFILGHIPPGTDSCLDRWSREYNRLVYRFRNTIVGQFYGHTHFDEFELFFTPHNKPGEPQATNVAYLAPSQTPHDGLNPAYRVYTIDGDYQETTHLPLDHQTYWFNLTESNQKLRNPNIQIKLEYSAKDTFGLKNLSPQSWYNLVERMATDENLFDKFRRFYSRSGPFYAGTNCDLDCKEKILCSLVTSRQSEQSHCKVLKQKLEVKNQIEVPVKTWWNYIWTLTESQKP